MGRHRRHPTTSNNVKKPTSFTDTESPDERVEQRLFGHAVCSDCDARNPSDADTCRKCGSNHLRAKSEMFNDDR